jgi:hypothetical protein
LSDTGDLVDQLAESEDPLHAALRAADPSSAGPSSRRAARRVHYLPDEAGSEKKRAGVVRKEDIPIPNPPPRRIPWGERLIVLAMAPNDGPSRLHGLHGKKLMCVPPSLLLRSSDCPDISRRYSCRSAFFFLDMIRASCPVS